MLKGTVALVTGGGSGLGRATVERFVKQGAKVVIADLSTSQSRDIADQLGESVVFSPTDVRSESDVQTAVNLAKEKFGKLDVAVNCAGIAAVHKTYNFNDNTPHPLDIFTNVLMVNTVGTFNVIRLAAGLIGQNEPNADGQRGVIVNTASITAYDGLVDLAAYSASKAAVVGMTLPIARDLSTQGIRIMTIAPGVFRTPMYNQVTEELRKAFEAAIPFPKRPGMPEEFAQLVQSIIENPLLNGETIRLDGGTRL